MHDFDSLLVPTFYAYAGLLAFATIIHASAAYLRVRRQMLHAYFALLCGIGTAFMLFDAAVTGSTETQAAIAYYRGLRLASDLFFLLYPGFIVLFLRRRSRLALAVSALWFMSILLYEYYAFQPEATELLSNFHSPTPWGEKLAWLSGRDPTLVTLRSMLAVVVTAVGFALAARASIDRLENRSHLLTLMTGIFLLGRIWDSSIQMNWIESFFVGEHLFMGFVVLMSLELLRELASGVRANERLGRLTVEMALTEQRERQKLAHALHDGPLQYLAMASLQAGRPDADQEQIVRQLGLAAEGVRSIVLQLNPPMLEKQGLAAALSWLAEETTKEADLDCTSRCGPGPFMLAQDVQVIVFQCVQELVRNAIKHAACDRIDIHCQTLSDVLRVVIEDNGKGFSNRAFSASGRDDGGYGLFSIKQRLLPLGGIVRVASSEAGTKATILFPKRTPA